MIGCNNNWTTWIPEEAHKIIVSTGGSNRVKILNWLHKNCEGSYFIYSNCVFIELEPDAVLFTLRWVK